MLIANVDCTQPGGESVCAQQQVKGYPTIKVFRNGRAEDYNGPREFSGLKKFVDANLAGPECSLEDKAGCSAEELKILEESEAMSVADRRAKIKEVEESVKMKKEEAKKLEKEAKELAQTLTLLKLGGDKPEKVEQLLGDAEFKEHCESRTCIVSFLPHILEGGAKARNDLLKTLNDVFKKAKADNHPVGFMWSQGGDQFELEEKMALQFGFPAVIAVNLKKGRFGVHRGTFDKDSLSGFLSSMMLGRVPLQPIPANFPKWGKVDAWDGKDGEMPVEEEL